jgi:chromate reductase
LLALFLGGACALTLFLGRACALALFLGRACMLVFIDCPLYAIKVFMICLISGTNRPGSTTLKVTKIFEKIYQNAGASTHLINLEDLPLEAFSPKAYSEKPASLKPFTDAVLASKGLVIFCPEYNGSMPGVLKYFIDMLPFPQSFEKRPVAFVGLASGMWGSLRGVEHLEGVFKYRNAHMFNERIFLPKVDSQFDQNGEFTSKLVKDLAHAQVKNFIRYCDTMNQYNS